MDKQRKLQQVIKLAESKEKVIQSDLIMDKNLKQLHQKRLSALKEMEAHNCNDIKEIEKEKRKQDSEKMENNVYRPLYVGYLQRNIKEKTLFDIFNNISPINNIGLYHNDKTGESCAYIFFKSTKHAQSQIGGLQDINVNGLQCIIGWITREIVDTNNDDNINYKYSENDFYIDNIDDTKDVSKKTGITMTTSNGVSLRYVCI